LLKLYWARRILTVFPPDDRRRPPGCLHVTWLKTIQQDLKSENFSLNEVIGMAQNRPLCRDCCLHLALRSACAACQKRTRRSQWIIVSAFRSKKFTAVPKLVSCHKHIVLNFYFVCQFSQNCSKRDGDSTIGVFYLPPQNSIFCCIACLGMFDHHWATTGWGLQEAQCSTRKHTTVCLCIGQGRGVRSRVCGVWVVFVQFILVRLPHCDSCPQHWPFYLTDPSHTRCE